MSLTWRKLHKSGWLRYAGLRPKPEHLLWTFMWLKCYFTENVGASIAGVDEKTYRDHVWFYLRGLAQLDVDVVSCSLFDTSTFYRAVLPIAIDPLYSPSASCFRYNGRID